MRVEFTLFGRSGSRRDMVVTGHPMARWDGALAPYAPLGEPIFVDGEPRSLDAPLGGGTVTNGSVVSVGTAVPRASWPLARPCLAVVSGAAAGEILLLRPGRLVVGRIGDLVIDDPGVSARHASIELSQQGVRVTDLGSSNGTVVAGRRLGAADPGLVAPGERFALGPAVVQLLAPVPPNAESIPGPEGERTFNRVHRYPSEPTEERVSIPADLEPPDSASAVPQYVGAGAMLATGVVTSLAFGNALFAVLGAVGPVVLLATSAVVQRRSGREHGRRRAAISEQREDARHRILEAARTEGDILWDQTLDPPRARLAAIGPTSDLWSSDPSDRGALRVRIGTADRPAHVVIQTSGDESVGPPLLLCSPVTVDLREHRVFGIAGPSEEAQAAARAIVHQIATSRSPGDLQLVHLCSGDFSSHWSWLRWLPHTRALHESAQTVTTSPTALKTRLDELAALIASRSDAVEHGQEILLPEVVVIADGAGALRTRTAVVNLLQQGGRVGVTVIAIDNHVSRLPAEATARLILGPRGTLEAKGATTVSDVVVDQMTEAACETSARALAPLRPHGGSEQSTLPTSVRFLDLVNLRDGRGSQVQVRWAGSAEGEAPLGVDEHGNVVSVNLVTDGPHALVAGTSGSGKSELLRTLIAGLAVNAPPEDLSFMLIDFKGGGAFGKLQSLPHVVAYADDLSIGGVLANRLLDSLKAELDYRKTHFKAAGNVEGLPGYRRARARVGASLPSIARLVIVVDEFAELKEAQPDFVDGLINVARVGRSLGVHLVLATQQPAGVVTPQIRDNANLRICLRVLDSATSSDLVHTPLAGSFPNRAKGRAVVSMGDSTPVVIQSALVSAPSRTADLDEIPAPDVAIVPWSACGLHAADGTRVEAGDESQSDLSDLVGLITDTAHDRGFPRPRRPWLPPLPELVRLDDVTSQGPDVGFGIEDRPRRQSHVPLVFPLGGGNLGIAGGRGSGRTTALRTLAAAIARHTDADAVHLHVIDYSPTPTLRVLSTLPHCGVVATRARRHVVDRLVQRLSEELSARSTLLGRAGHATLEEARLAGLDVPPRIVLLIDGWDALTAGVEGEDVRDALVRLAEEGPGLGLQLVVAGGKAIGAGRLSSSLGELLVLRFEQAEDLTYFGIPGRSLPPQIPAGRAFTSGSPDSAHIAVLDGATTAEGQGDALRCIASQLPTAARFQPMRIEEMPEAITLAEALTREGAPERASDGVIVAVGGDDLTPRRIDLGRLSTPFVVGGPSGSGRTNALAVIARQAAARGQHVFVSNVAPEELGRFGPAAAEVTAEGVVPPQSIVLIDDAHRLSAQDPLVLDLWNRNDVSLCLALDPNGLEFLGWKGRLLAGATGLLLSPTLNGGEVIGARIGHGQTFSAGPGRAYLGANGSFELVQIPLHP